MKNDLNIEKAWQDDAKRNFERTVQSVINNCEEDFSGVRFEYCCGVTEVSFQGSPLAYLGKLDEVIDLVWNCINSLVYPVHKEGLTTPLEMLRTCYDVTFSESTIATCRRISVESLKAKRHYVEFDELNATPRKAIRTAIKSALIRNPVGPLMSLVFECVKDRLTKAITQDEPGCLIFTTIPSQVDENGVGLLQKLGFTPINSFLNPNSTNIVTMWVMNASTTKPSKVNRRR